MKDRIMWIDTAKGLLIILMVIGHVSNLAGHNGIEFSFLSKCIFFSSVYTCFFMQAFILLSGYTSNFNKPVLDFFSSLIKTILIPWLSFSVLTKVISVLLYGDSWYYDMAGDRYLFLIEDFWFLHVLFFGKIIYYFIYHHIKSDVFRGFILLILMFIGFYFIIIPGDLGAGYHQHNYLHFKDTLVMTVFIWLGNLFRRYDVLNRLKGKVLACILVLYVLGHAARLGLHVMGLHSLLVTPVVISHSANISSYFQVPVFLYYTILGSLACFGLIQYIKDNAVLKYFGKNSLVVYCSHFVILNGIIIMLNKITPPHFCFECNPVYYN